jgi:hypothetical protein
MSGPLFGAEPEKVKPAKPEPVLTTREISRLVRYYNEKIRLHSVQDTRGVYRQIQLLLAPKAGRELISPQDVADAIKNYEKDDFTKSLPQQRRMSMRRFFTYENIFVWRKPAVVKSVRRDKSFDTLDRVEANMRPVESAPTPPATDEPGDEKVTF